MNYKIEIPRKSYDGLCAFLQMWGDVYSVSGAVVLRGSLRSERKRGRGSAVVHSTAGCGDAGAIALRYNTARCGLGRAKVLKNVAILDLRDLTEAEMDAMEFVSKVAMLKPQQTQVVERIKFEVHEFLKMPAMMRLAVAAQD